MKITMGEYEIDIKAKQVRYHDRMNKADTLDFLNTVAVILGAAVEHYDKKGLFALKKYYYNMHSELHDQLDAAGLYDDLD